MKVALDVPEEQFYVGMVRQIGRALLEFHRVDAQDIDEVEAMVGELCANAACHARSELGRYRVILEHQEDRVVVAVVDEGTGFDPSRLPPVGEPRPDADGALRHGGFGLHLVRALADRVDIESSHPCGTTVRAEKRLRRVSPLPGDE